MAVEADFEFPATAFLASADSLVVDFGGTVVLKNRKRPLEAWFDTLCSQIESQAYILKVLQHLKCRELDFSKSIMGSKDNIFGNIHI